MWRSAGEWRRPVRVGSWKGGSRCSGGCVVVALLCCGLVFVVVASFVRSFVRFVRSFASFASFVVVLSPSFLPSFLPSFVPFFVRSFLPSFAPSLLRSFVCSFVRSFVCGLCLLFRRCYFSFVAVVHSFVVVVRSFVRSFVVVAIIRFRCRCVVAVRLMCVVLSCSRCCFVLLSVLPSGRLTVCLLGPLVARCSGHHHACRGGGDVSGTRKDFASAACVVFVAGRCRALCAGGTMRWNWALCAGSSVPVQSMRWSPVSRKMGVVAKATTVHTEANARFNNERNEITLERRTRRAEGRFNGTA